MSKKIILCAFIVCMCLPHTPVLSAPKKAAAPARAADTCAITDVKVKPQSFNPAQGETAEITFRVSQPAKIILKLFDAEQRLVAQLFSEAEPGSEVSSMVWNGRDMEGVIVPDEAYTMAIDAVTYQGKISSYDPATFSGGEYVELEKLAYNQKNRVVTYHVNKDSRVRIRAGIGDGGPMLKKVAVWKPRLKGERAEAWDGKDESGAVYFADSKKFVIWGEALSMPENSIFTRGNRDSDYFAYKKKLPVPRPEKEKRPAFRSRDTDLAMLRGVQVTLKQEPRFTLKLPKTPLHASGLPLVRGTCPITLYIDKNIKRHITEERYEVIFYVDYKFSTEAEEGFSPFTVMWDTRAVPNGERTITINVATFGGQISSASRRVFVEN
jgi:hypothetical protein